MKTIPELSPKDIKRFWSKVDIKKEDECWEWTASKEGTDKLYGQFFVAGSIYRAHRISLFLDTNEQGEVARHSCDNPGCCNPKHLIWGSHSDNINDKMLRKRHKALPGDNNGNSKLKESDVIFIRESNTNGRLTRKQLVDMFKVSESCIEFIINRRSWKHI